MKGEARANMRKAKKDVEEWNAAHPVGIEVLLTKDNGTEFLTKTRSAALVGGGGGWAVIFVEGISGYYLLSRVRPASFVETARST